MSQIDQQNKQDKQVERSFRPEDAVLVSGSMSPVKAKILESNHWYSIRVESTHKCPYGERCYRNMNSVGPYHRINEPINISNYHGPTHWHILGLHWKNGNGDYRDVVQPLVQSQFQPQFQSQFRPQYQPPPQPVDYNMGSHDGWHQNGYQNGYQYQQYQTMWPAPGEHCHSVHQKHGTKSAPHYLYYV